MKKIPEQYKNLIYIGGTAVIAVWIFCIVFVITYNSQQKKQHVQNTTYYVIGTSEQAQTSPSSYYSSMSTTQATTTEPTNDSNLVDTNPYALFGGNNVTTSAEYVKPSWAEQSQANEQYADNKEKMPSTKEDIVKTYVNAVNALKNCDKFKLEKVNEAKITVDSVTAGLDSVVQKYIDINNDTTPKTFNFVNGNDAATGSTPNAEIAPDSKECTLSPNDVEDAKCSMTSNGGYKIVITLPQRKQTLDAPATPYANSTDIISLESLNLDSTIKIDTLEVIYSNAKITAILDSQGRITSIEQIVTVSEATTTGKVLVVPANLKMHGTNIGKYTITY